MPLRFFDTLERGVVNHAGSARRGWSAVCRITDGCRRLPRWPVGRLFAARLAIAAVLLGTMLGSDWAWGQPDPAGGPDPAGAAAEAQSGAQTQSDAQADSALAAEQDGAVDSRRARVLELVDGLDASRLAARQQAERELIELGPDVLPWLPKLDARYSAEARQRLRRVRVALEQLRAVAGARAKELQLGKVEDLATALERITDATGIRFHLGEASEQPISVELDARLPFWAVLDTVLDAADADVDFYNGQPGELGIGPRAEGRPSRTDTAAYASVFRLEPTSVFARRNLHRPSLDGLSVGMQIAWEPRLTPIGLSLPLQTVVAKLDDGQKLQPQEGQISISANSVVPMAEFNLPLPLPVEKPRRIETIQGTLHAILPGATEEFLVPLAEKHEGERVGNVTVTVEDVRPNNQLYEVRVEVAIEKAGVALESHRQWIFENEAYVTGPSASGPDAARIEHLGTQTYRQTADRVGIAYMFKLGDSLEGMTFHYRTPVSVVEEDIDFVLRDIPLP